MSYAVLKMQWMEERSLGGVWRVWERRKRASKRRVGRYLASGCLVKVRGEGRGSKPSISMVDI